MRELSQSAPARPRVGDRRLKLDAMTPKSRNYPLAAHRRHEGSGMTSNKGYRRQTWLINLLIGMVLVLGGIGLFGLARSQAALETMVEKRVVATVQAAPDLSPANLSALVQQQADKAHEDAADAARLHGRLRAAILLTIVLGIACAAAYGSGLPHEPVQPLPAEPPVVVQTQNAPALSLDSPPTEPLPLPATEPPEGWDGSNRRGPNRARNVARIPKKPAPPEGRGPSDDRREAVDDWEPF
jgi:hypothetical protein